MMRSGTLDRKIDIQRRTQTQSGSGEPTEGWANVITRRSASVKPLSGDERFGAPQEVAREQIEIRIRYSMDVAGVSPVDRVIYPALGDGEVITERRICDILAVNEIGRREGLMIIAQRRVDAS